MTMFTRFSERIFDPIHYTCIFRRIYFKYIFIYYMKERLLYSHIIWKNVYYIPISYERSSWKTLHKMFCLHKGFPRNRTLWYSTPQLWTDFLFICIYLFIYTYSSGLTTFYLFICIYIIYIYYIHINVLYISTPQLWTDFLFLFIYMCNVYIYK